MAQQVACVSCRSFFIPDPEDLLTFICERADPAYLRRIPFPSQYKKSFSRQSTFVAFLLSGYCPYCREVKFGYAAAIVPENIGISESRYLACLRAEIRSMTGMQIYDIPEDYIALVDDDEN